MPNIKTAISIPAPLFAEAEKMARAMSVSRSEFFSLAVEDYLRRHESRQLLKKIDASCGNLNPDETYRARAKVRHRQIVEGEW